VVAVSGEPSEPFGLGRECLGLADLRANQMESFAGEDVHVLEQKQIYAAGVGMLFRMFAAKLCRIFGSLIKS
jgi:hypothetical protein